MPALYFQNKNTFALTNIRTNIQRKSRHLLLIELLLKYFLRKLSVLCMYMNLPYKEY